MSTLERVSVYDLTDAQVDAIVAARRATAPAYDTEWLDLLIIARDHFEAAAIRRAEDQRIRTLHRCARCGIDTAAVELCIDCWDVDPAFGSAA